MGKCMYCKTAIPDDSVLDVCRRCGIGVWGEKMFQAILDNMQGAKEAGDLYQGSVTQNMNQVRETPKSNGIKQPFSHKSNSSSTSGNALSSIKETALMNLENSD